jgi:hypothetical protein
MVYHDCPNAQNLPSPIREIAGYDWNMSGVQTCQNGCGAVVSNKVKWPHYDKNHPFRQLKEELNKIHGIP